MLEVTVPEEAELGSLADVVELRTQVAGEELTEIQIRGRIFKAVGPR